MTFPADALPRVLWVETALAVPAVFLGLVPWLLTTMTELRVSIGPAITWAFVALALVLLWVLLLVHVVADCWLLLRDGLTHLTEWGLGHVVFRVVETLGVVAAPTVFYVIASAFSGDTGSAGPAAVGGLFIVFGALAANAVVVVLHAVWLLGVGYADRTAPNPTA